MNTEIRLGDSMEMAGITYKQDDALLLLQDSNSKLRIHVEKALSTMVRFHHEGYIIQFVLVLWYRNNTRFC